MPPVYVASELNTRLTEVVTALDAAGTPTCQLLDAANNVLSTLTMHNPAGTVSGGVLTFTTPWTDPAAALSGTAVAAQLRDGSGNIVVTGLTVGTVAGNDIILSGPIAASHTVTITSATIAGRGQLAPAAIRTQAGVAKHLVLRIALLNVVELATLVTRTEALGCHAGGFVRLGGYLSIAWQVGRFKALELTAGGG